MPPPGPRSRTAPRTPPSPTCAGRWHEPPSDGSAPTSCSNSASPSVRRRPAGSGSLRGRSRHTRRPAAQSRSRSRWDAAPRSAAATDESLRCSSRTRARLGDADRRAALDARGRRARTRRSSTRNTADACRTSGSPTPPCEGARLPPSVFGTLAVDAADANEPAGVSRPARAARARRRRLLPEQRSTTPVLYHASNALMFAERYEALEHAFAKRSQTPADLVPAARARALCYRALLTCAPATSPTPRPTHAWRSRPGPACPACTPPWTPSPLLLETASPSARMIVAKGGGGGRRTLPSSPSIPDDDAGRMANRSPRHGFAGRAPPGRGPRRPARPAGGASSLACESPPRRSRLALRRRLRTSRSAPRRGQALGEPKRSRSPRP